MLYVMNTSKIIVTKVETKKDLIPFYNESIEVYKALFKRTFGYETKVDNFIRVYANFKSLLDSGFTKDQIVALIFCHFEWRGLDGKNESKYENVKSHGFPLGWINTRSNEYALYIERTLTPKLWNDPEYMSKLVDRWTLHLFVDLDDF